MLKNGQTYFNNLAAFTPQDIWSMFGHFTALWMEWLKTHIYFSAWKVSQTRTFSASFFLNKSLSHTIINKKIFSKNTCSYNLHSGMYKLHCQNTKVNIRLSVLLSWGHRKGKLVRNGLRPSCYLTVQRQQWKR